jgi:hypothetical protein
MTDNAKTENETEPDRPRVIADFGGRRKVLDRRSMLNEIQHPDPERRSGKDRRSGFDRRGVLTQDIDIKTEKRHEFDKAEPISKKLDNGAE